MSRVTAAPAQVERETQVPKKAIADSKVISRPEDEIEVREFKLTSEARRILTGVDEEKDSQECPPAQR